MKLLITAAIVGLANIAALSYALEQSDDADRAYIETVKLDVKDMTDDEYRQSEQYKTAKHANHFLRQAYKEQGYE